MATSITFTDDTGSATLSNGYSAPADRFDLWVPMQAPIGPSAYALGTGSRSQWTFRTDYGASFQLSKISHSSLDKVLRLIAHLMGGGTCTVNTGDASSRSYATCSLAPDTTPSLELTDRKLLRYTLTLAVINTADTPTAMLCVY